MNGGKYDINELVEENKSLKAKLRQIKTATLANIVSNLILILMKMMISIMMNYQQ